MNQRPLRPENAGDPTQAPKKKHVATDKAGACTNACTSKAENRPNEADRLEVIADLLANLPVDQREEVIAELEAAERAAIARLLISKKPKKVKQSKRGQGIRCDE